MRLFERLQNIDRRIMYLLLAVVLITPLFFRKELPVVVTPAAKSAYDTIEKMSPDKLAIVDIWWAAGTEAENSPQTEVIMRHLFMRNKKFAIIAFDPQGSKFAGDIASRLAREMHKKYGVDYVNWGYRTSANAVLIVQGLARNIPKTIVADKYGTPLSKIPVMNGMKTIDNIGLVASVTPSASIGIWISFIYGPYKTPIVYAPTSVSGPEGFNYLDSGQIKGMLIGMRGAAEYERLLHVRGFATRGTPALSSSHILIIVLIILGNIGYLATRRRRADSAGGKGAAVV